MIKGRWLDNGLVERLWRSAKFGDGYLRAHDAAAELRRGLNR